MLLQVAFVCLPFWSCCSHQAGSGFCFPFRLRREKQEAMEKSLELLLWRAQEPGGTLPELGVGLVGRLLPSPSLARAAELCVRILCPLEAMGRGR